MVAIAQVKILFIYGSVYITFKLFFGAWRHVSLHPTSPLSQAVIHLCHPYSVIYFMDSILADSFCIAKNDVNG